MPVTEKKLPRSSTCSRQHNSNVIWQLLTNERAEEDQLLLARGCTDPCWLQRKSHVQETQFPPRLRRPGGRQSRLIISLAQVLCLLPASPAFPYFFSFSSRSPIFLPRPLQFCCPGCPPCLSLLPLRTGSLPPHSPSNFSLLSQSSFSSKTTLSCPTHLLICPATILLSTNA